ncbi:hypothetical protein FDENT_12080 [Fusarium denticulatum]|uniref:Uncharacterized protein n=1 Tax=Fusarium denticulatum TaxID=48507 RepID=A0A8H5WRC9_9HYPO|nr:hypothetical protein FDENT_12080 [Fusarium denticulatum]
MGGPFDETELTTFSLSTYLASWTAILHPTTNENDPPRTTQSSFAFDNQKNYCLEVQEWRGRYVLDWDLQAKLCLRLQRLGRVPLLPTGSLPLLTASLRNQMVEVLDISLLLIVLIRAKVDVKLGHLDINMHTPSKRWPPYRQVCPDLNRDMCVNKLEVDVEANTNTNACIRIEVERLIVDEEVGKSVKPSFDRASAKGYDSEGLMIVGDFLKLEKMATPIVADSSKDVNDLGAEVISVKPDLFTSLLSTFNEKNERQVGKKPNSDQYKYLSHVRKINTKGMAIAGVEDFGIFSCVISNRYGPLNNPTAANISVHLVSIEGVEDMEWPKSGQSRVGLCSLHNWTYTVLPPGQFNVRAYRVQTGEKTVALYRGPFTPVRVELNEQLNKCSNSGQVFQILDKKIGRNLALGDKAYVAALSRLRSILRTKTMKACKVDAVTDAGTEQSYRSRDDLLKDLPKTIERLHQIQLAVPPAPVGDRPHCFAPGGAKKRWYRPELSKRQYPKLGFSSKPIQEKYLEAAVEIVLKQLSMVKDGRVYDETNDPVSTDWMVVLAWILDHPSHVPPESLRFFHIDPNWVDAMIDGALSLANHMGQDLDRVAIKHGSNRYLDYKSPKLNHRPQVPTYGFYLRSDLVTLYPDLRVHTTGADTGRAPLLRHEIIADGVMLGLFDCIPGQDFKTLNFTQPPHQQRFAAGWYLEADRLEVSIGRQFTVDPKYQDYSKKEEK